MFLALFTAESRFLTRVVCRMWPKLDIAPLCTFYAGLGTARLRQSPGCPCLMLAQVLREKRPGSLVLLTFGQITFSPLKIVVPLERTNISEMSVILESPLHGNLET